MNTLQSLEQDLVEMSAALRPYWWAKSNHDPYYGDAPATTDAEYLICVRYLRVYNEALSMGYRHKVAELWENYALYTVYEATYKEVHHGR